MFIPAYCSLQFIEQITTRNPIDFVSPERLSADRIHIDICDLILNGLSIKTDCSKEKIDEKVSTNPCLKYLIKEFRIKPADNDFKELRLNENSFIESLSEATILFFLTGSDMLINNYVQKSGRHFFSLTSSFNVLFEEDIQTFDPNENMSWQFARRFFNPHHSLIIADPYLFKEVTRNAIEDLLLEVKPEKLKTEYHITLIGSDINKKNDLPDKRQIETWENKISKILNRYIPAVVEYHIFNNEEFHDRYLITNNACIFSGYGIDIIKNERVKKDGTWIAFRPFKRVNVNGDNDVFFYKVMQKKLAMMKKWVEKSSNKISSNPLFRL